MKRIDYFWPRVAMQITGIPLLVELIQEVVGNRKPGFEWVLQALALAFVVACGWCVYAVVRNAIRARGQA